MQPRLYFKTCSVILHKLSIMWKTFQNVYSEYCMKLKNRCHYDKQEWYIWECTPEIQMLAPPLCWPWDFPPVCSHWQLHRPSSGNTACAVCVASLCQTALVIWTWQTLPTLGTQPWLGLVEGGPEAQNMSVETHHFCKKHQFSVYTGII